MTLRERLEWASRMALLVFILAAAAFLSAITAMRIAIHGREVNMPNLVGRNVSEANGLLHSRGLVLRVADRIYSELPINVVVRQSPACDRHDSVAVMVVQQIRKGPLADEKRAEFCLIVPLGSGECPGDFAQSFEEPAFHWTHVIILNCSAIRTSPQFRRFGWPELTVGLHPDNPLANRCALVWNGVRRPGLRH